MNIFQKLLSSKIHYQRPLDNHQNHPAHPLTTVKTNSLRSLKKMPMAQPEMMRRGMELRRKKGGYSSGVGVGY